MQKRLIISILFIPAILITICWEFLSFLSYPIIAWIYWIRTGKTDINHIFDKIVRIPIDTWKSIL